MTRKPKPVYPDYTTTSYSSDIVALKDSFANLYTQGTLRAVGIGVGNEQAMITYNESLYTLKTIYRKYPNDKKVVQMMQDKLHLVGKAIHGTDNMDAINLASDFLADMGKILTSDKVSPSNQFRVAYGLSKAIDCSRYNIHTKMNGTFSEKEDSFLGIVLKEKNFPCMAAMSGMLKCRFVEPSIKGLNLSAETLDGVFFVLHGNYGIDSYTKKTALKMYNQAMMVTEGIFYERIRHTLNER